MGFIKNAYLGLSGLTSLAASAAVATLGYDNLDVLNHTLADSSAPFWMRAFSGLVYAMPVIGAVGALCAKDELAKEYSAYKEKKELAKEPQEGEFELDEVAPNGKAYKVRGHTARMGTGEYWLSARIVGEELHNYTMVEFESGYAAAMKRAAEMAKELKIRYEKAVGSDAA